mgnify:CR=1 FL=1
MCVIISSVHILLEQNINMQTVYNNAEQTEADHF